MGNVISGLAFVVFAGVFWVQRNYTSKFGGLFADPVIIAMAVLGLVLALLGLVQRRPSEHKSEVPLAGLIRAVLLLVAWVSLPGSRCCPRWATPSAASCSSCSPRY